MRRRSLALAALLLLAVLAGACGDDGDPASAERSRTDASGGAPTTGDGGPEALTVEVLAVHPHDDRAYTQGLLVDEGRLIESTGQYGESTLREVELGSGAVLRSRALPDDRFGEGLALVDDRLVQLTWREGVAVVYDRDTFDVVGHHAYEGEGWGLCLDEARDRLVMSDGSATLTFRDPRTFAVTGSVEVTEAGEPVDQLNELECVDGDVYANVYRTDEIVRVDGASGEVRATIDASPLRDALGAAPRAEVLNGIAHDPSSGTFHLTGKYWPRLFEVRFVPAG